MTTVGRSDWHLTDGAQLRAGDDGPLAQQTFYPVVSRSGQRVPVGVASPEPEVLTADEACRFLRLDVLHDGNMIKARAALRRLVETRALVPIVYSGPGGGRRMYPRQALRDFVERQMGR